MRQSLRTLKLHSVLVVGPLSWNILLIPFYYLVKEYQDVVCHDPPSALPPDRGIRHEIDLVPRTKYCITRQWTLPKKQCDVIDEFFRAMHAEGMMRESKSPHSTPTFCVRKANGKWCIVHAYNKLNAATTRHRDLFLERMFFRTLRWVAPCLAHSTWSMDIINCSCDRVTSRSQRWVLRVACCGSGLLFPKGYRMLQ